MSRRRSCIDHAATASWFSTVKLELGEMFPSMGRAKEQRFEDIEVFSNQQCRSSTT
jgi:hypothetical protein